MMPTRNSENIEHEYNQTTNNNNINNPSSPYHTYNRNSRVFSAMNHHQPTVIYHHPQTGFQQSSSNDLSHDPRRYGMAIAPNTNATMQGGGLLQLDPHNMGGMITNAQSQYPIAYRTAPDSQFPNAGNIYLTADGQRISHVGGMQMTATSPHYAYGGVELTPDQMQQLPPLPLSSTPTQASFLSQSEREEELLLQLLIARRNRTQQTGLGANDSLADELMRLRQSRGFQSSSSTGFSSATTMNQSVMDSSLGGSMQRQFLPDLNGRIDRNPKRLVDARTQDMMMDLSQRSSGKRSGQDKFGQEQQMYMEEEDVVPQKKPKRAHRKKPADMPRRPLSAYNLFFSEERERILKEIESKEEGESKADVDAEPVVEKKASEDQSEGADDKKSEDGDEDLSGKPKAFLRPLLATEKKRRPHRKTHGKISFQTLARMVGERWKNLAEERRKYYQDLAEEDAKRQKAAMEEYYAKQSTRKKGEEVEKANEEEEEEMIEKGDDETNEKEESPVAAPAVPVDKDVVV